MFLQCFVDLLSKLDEVGDPLAGPVQIEDDGQLRQR